MFVYLLRTLCSTLVISAWPTRALGTSTESASNPLKFNYPEGTITGTINGTVAVIPIPYEIARVCPFLSKYIS